MDLRTYIEDRSIPIPFAGCWMWLLSCGSHGYGQAYCPPDRVTTAHRVAYRAFKGPIPDGLLVQHTCDQRWCVNPDHLELGTDQTNCDDKVRKGRDGREKKFGRIPVNRKLTSDQVAAIRTTQGTEREIAKIFGITQTQVSRVKRGLVYKDVASNLRPASFQVDDLVSWTTKNYGKSHSKVGTIVEVVAPKASPTVAPDGLKAIVPRSRESYVVTSDGHRYWPIASELKLVSRKR